MLLFILLCLSIIVCEPIALCESIVLCVSIVLCESIIRFVNLLFNLWIYCSICESIVQFVNLSLYLNNHTLLIYHHSDSIYFLFESIILCESIYMFLIFLHVYLSFYVSPSFWFYLLGSFQANSHKTNSAAEFEHSPLLFCKKESILSSYLYLSAKMCVAE